MIQMMNLFYKIEYIIEMAENPWLVHVRKVRACNPCLTYKEVLIKAKETYKKESK